MSEIGKMENLKLQIPSELEFEQYAMGGLCQKLAHHNSSVIKLIIVFALYPNSGLRQVRHILRQRSV